MDGAVFLVLLVRYSVRDSLMVRDCLIPIVRGFPDLLTMRSPLEPLFLSPTQACTVRGLVRREGQLG